MSKKRGFDYVQGQTMTRYAWNLSRFLAKTILPSRLFTWLRLMRDQRTLAHYEARQVRHTYGGVLLDLYIADHLSEAWYDRDWDESEVSEIVFLRHSKLKSGAKVFDLGAHQCVIALLLAQEVGLEGSVIAVEPNAHNVMVSKKNRKRNGAEQLEILHAAVAERSGTVVFDERLTGRVSTESGGVEVQAFSIDDLTWKYGTPDVLWIDVEGLECRVLQGARETLTHKPDCFIEVHVGEGLEHFGGSVERILSVFSGTDYKLFIASEENRVFRKLTPGDDLMKSRFFLIASSQDLAS
jgi:FkbM family methyltransferase